jgi:S-DNA-T family DNA segregation ATPase FtsK/SpoIIIE
MELRLDRLLGNRRFNEALGFLLIVLAVVSLLALLSYSAADATWFNSQPGGVETRNWIGPVGASLAEALLQLFGVTAFLLPVVIALAGWGRFRPAKEPPSYYRIAGHAVLALSLLAFLDVIYRPLSYGGLEFEPGGFFGLALASALRAILNTPGALLVSLAALVVSLLLLTRISLVRLGEKMRPWLQRGWASLTSLWSKWRERRQHPAPWREQASQPPEEPRVRRQPSPQEEQPAPRAPIALEGQTDAAPSENSPPPRPGPAAAQRPAVPRPRARKDPAPGKQAALPMERGRRGYSLPSLDLLAEGEPQTRESEAQLRDRAQQITEKFHEFNIEGRVVAIHPGPVVTTFEFKPAAGIKYSKITGMTDDLSLALKAESVRIDRLPGRSTVGIEVPNRHQETIYPRELLGSERFRESRSKLSLALGKDIHGDVFTADLDRMPHLLIAGATGAGKSVGLNGMIASMLYKATPEDLRFIMIDTKMIELGVYAEIPHLLIPVVTDPKLASTALKWAVREMEQRYHKLAAVGVRNLAQFNALLAEEPDRTMSDPKSGEPVQLEHLPYIVIVIDEMADLMMISSADVEESVMRLAQMARAVGIHLILATQRPSVDVITGTIKANFPSRIAFRVSQRVDSRTIIDQQGAEHLLGRGDMLYLSTGSARLRRLHSGFITEPEINRLTSFLKKMAEPVYDESVLAEKEESRGGVENGEKDEVYWEAVRTVINEGKCSITLIQRRLSLGYARAARIVDVMESEGVVSPGEGSKPREVLVGPEFLEAAGTR